MKPNEYLKLIAERKNLTQEEAEELANMLLDKNIDESLASAILISLKMKGETSDEIVGFVRSLRKHALGFDYRDAIDIVGTGGDGLNTINVSTISSILISNKYKVAKHGNRASSSLSGSADFLETVGYNINIDVNKAKELLEKTNFVFLFAQAYHLSMKNVAGIRKKLGIRTIFNLIGPLSNPFNVDTILIGVYPYNYIDVLADAVKELKYKRAILVSGEPGLDEVSPMGKTTVIEIKNDKEDRYQLSPEDFKIERFNINKVSVNNPEESAIRAIRASIGKDEFAEKFIRINTSMGLYLINEVDSLYEGYEVSGELLSKLPQRLIDLVSINGNQDKLKNILVRAYD
ncbi:anthranilate phosphoribosyltransferase [Caldisphaera lagunensis DSM 15908]|uniref:Anthranilate phosphoribosyltransferase n=1 Tax=Caldisphaera lagunensis (strain DSM 15908 / JCM 11604 / ANMR 0165 / IC-154) TaxID=1056495 RepID=L0A7T4_CALLD|nr:anthranilate phosphoribosyltransferase [Caldisphaera lagunensis]AFZ69891.1 anthranilate phosphoribosyltransferase [Caldisphaera lagunensis DSM 15908]